MFFYLLIVPGLIWIFVEIIKIKKIKKHDVVLYRFCQIRRDVMVVLREKGLSQSREEYLLHKRLLEALNKTIHYYDDLKTSLFNWRKFFEYLKEVRETATEIDKFELPEDSRITELYNGFVSAWFKALYAYTPFLREILLRPIMFLLKKVFAYSYYRSLRSFIVTLNGLIEKFEVPPKISKPITAAMVVN